VYLANVDGHPSLASLARRLGGSPYHLQRSFKRIVGVTPREYAEACRLRTVKRRLREGRAVISAVFDAGYGSSSRFYERAAPRLGMSPSAYRRGGDGLSLRFTIVDSPLGRLLVAATTRGVCSVALADSDAELERALSLEYPAATIVKDDGSLERWAQAIVARVNSPWCNSVVAPRAALRPAGKARRPSIPGVFEGGATPPGPGSPTRQPRWGGGGMQRRSHADGLAPRAA